MNAASWLEGLPAPEKWRTLLLAHGPRIATWTLAVLIAVQAAVIVTGLGGASSSARPAGAGTLITSQRHMVDVAAIVNAHLMGFTPAAAIAEDPTRAPISSVPLVLTGIMSADDPRYGLAILGQTAQSTKVYAVGDKIGRAHV